MRDTGFLRIPPFPGCRVRLLGVPVAALSCKPGLSAQALASLLRGARVGGNFWGPQPSLPEHRTILLCPDNAAQAREMAEWARVGDRRTQCAVLGRWLALARLPWLPATCDPWHLAGAATRVVAGGSHEIALVAAILETPLTLFGRGRYEGLDAAASRTAFMAELAEGYVYREPWTGTEIAMEDAIAILGDWRRMIDDNRRADGILGMARWKRKATDALLWDGGGAVRHRGRFMHAPQRQGAATRVLAWRSRAPAATLNRLSAAGVAVGEIEDGMIRSAGLGVNCVAPQSLIVDFAGAHFDPARASTLETMLEGEPLPAGLVERGRRLRERIVAAGIGKYGVDGALDVHPERPQGRETLLVVGQVADDRSVLCGGAGLGNIDVLRRARRDHPAAVILFKPHPDVEAGHRRGAIPDRLALESADRVVRDETLTALFAQVDAVHVLTSLAGFEALLHGKRVVTHGVPFYAGWGLTVDLGPVPARRTRTRTLDELVAATLLLYPRYIDPVTGIPCPAEVVVERLAAGWRPRRTVLEMARVQQGRLRRALGGRKQDCGAP